MASDVDSPPSRLGRDPDPDPDSDTDHLPIAERRRRLVRPPPAPRMELPSPPPPDRCEATAAAEGACGGAQQSWPGLPRGAQFNPSDSDLLWHLAAELGNGLAHRHPFISEFIKSADEDRGFERTHPQDIPGVQQDGHASYFFHKKLKLYNNENDKYISWQKSGASRSIILDGSLKGCKEVFVLYAHKKNDNSPQRTDWKLHQYHIKNTIQDEGELVVSKIFYKSEKNHSEWAVEAPFQSAQDDSVIDNDSKEDNKDAQVENCSSNMATESYLVEGNGNNQEQVLIEMYPDQDKLSPCKDVLETTHINHGNQINDDAETELDHISLQERYRILQADKHSCSARVSPEKCAWNVSYSSSREMGAEASGPVPKSESEEIDACRNHEGPACREDICSMLQEISSAPPIVDGMGSDNSVRLLDEIPTDPQVSPMECFVDSNDIPPDPVEDTEGPVSGKILDSSAELLSSEVPTRGNENVHLAATNPETYLVDVKMEPALEGYAIYPSESPWVKSHNSKNGGMEDSGSVPQCSSKDSKTDFELLNGTGHLAVKASADCACSKQCEDPKHVIEGCSRVDSINIGSSDICNIIYEAASSQANSTHAEGPLPSIGVKSELSGFELPGLCENNSVNIIEPIGKITGGLAYCSRKRKKRKMATDSSEKVLEDAYKNDEGIARPSHRGRRKKKTATDSIEKALEEDAPGLLQILLDRGITVKEIKLYDVEEDNEMLPDCTESDFQDLENVITKLFPQRTSLLKSAARHRHAKGEKAIYCLACLISLIEQSRYLQFRHCPVEWGWCRDLQSFIFVFRSHNRLVLERPEYGYATYFFEIVQSLPIEWQIRRMVTAMKLSSCGRTALIENRPLLVGEDLTEGEAQVLEEYGWIPNAGLGTMLNYRDRVVHDRWNEKYSTDWRMKIGKLLMNGYSQGQLITTHMPKKLGTLSEDSEIKLEEDPF